MGKSVFIPRTYKDWWCITSYSHRAIAISVQYTESIFAWCIDTAEGQALEKGTVDGPLRHGTKGRLGHAYWVQGIRKTFYMNSIVCLQLVRMEMP